MTKAYYIDTFSTGHLHEMFNASSLMMFASMYDHIEYRASSSSYEHVLLLLGSLPENVSYQPLRVIDAYKGWKRFRFFYKQFQALVHNVLFILFTPKGNDILFNYNTLAALPAMNRVARYTKNRILQICHGEMAELEKPYSKNRLLRRGVRLLKQGKNIADNMYFAVLGKAIYTNVFPLVGHDVQKKLLYFEHSAIFSDKSENIQKEHSKLIIGTIGAMRESKGESMLVKLAQQLKGCPNLEIRCLGKCTLPKETMTEAGITIPDSCYERYLTREELYEQIKQLDYALFLFPTDLYKYTASGSVFDAVVCKTPILALANDYFKGLFAAYGDFGYLEDDIENLAQRIQWLVNQGECRPDWEMSRLCERMSPDAVAEQFSKQWKNR